MKQHDPFAFSPPDWARDVRFYITAEQACPYLSERKERKIFASLAIAEPLALNRSLTRAGFRRSQNIIYRPACKNCSACRSVRIPVEQFKMSKRWQRVLRNNSDLDTSWQPNRATKEQYNLLRSYLDSRHPDGGMNEMSIIDYASMVETSLIATKMLEYRQDNKLLGAALTDILHDGLSIIYSFFDISEQAKRRSLGSYIILDAIRQAEKLGLPYVYLGYWVGNSPKMRYKAAFQPLEVYDGSVWKNLVIK